MQIFHDDQTRDNISVHRGIEEGRGGSRDPSTGKQSSILSRLSAARKKTNPDHTSLLDNEESSDSEIEMTTHV